MAKSLLDTKELIQDFGISIAYSKLIEVLYIVLFTILFVTALLLGFGNESLVIQNLPIWNLYYSSSKVIVSVFSAISIILILNKYRRISFYFIGIFLLYFISWVIIELIIILFTSFSDSETIFLMFNILICTLLFLKLKFINIMIIEGI